MRASIPRSTWLTAAATFALGAALTASALGGKPANAGEPAATTATPSAAASPVTTAAPSATSPSGATLPAFDGEPFGDEASKAPTAEEWKAAKELAPSRRSARADGCHVWRVREWVRVSCPDLVTASMSLLGGSPTGISFWIDPPREGADAKLPAGGEVMFPVKKGDRRVVQFLSFGPGYEGPLTQLPALVVQEAWLEDAPAPTLLLY